MSLRAISRAQFSCIFHANIRNKVYHRFPVVVIALFPINIYADGVAAIRPVPVLAVHHDRLLRVAILAIIVVFKRFDRIDGRLRRWACRLRWLRRLKRRVFPFLPIQG